MGVAHQVLALEINRFLMNYLVTPRHFPFLEIGPMSLRIQSNTHRERKHNAIRYRSQTLSFSETSHFKRLRYFNVFRFFGKWDAQKLSTLPLTTDCPVQLASRYVIQQRQQPGAQANSVPTCFPTRVFLFRAR